MGARELQVLPETLCEREPMDHAEHYREEYAASRVYTNDVFECGIYDRKRDEHLYERLEPCALWSEAERRADQRERVRQGKRRHDGQQWNHSAQHWRNNEAQDEQQMVESGDDVTYA